MQLQHLATWTLSSAVRTRQRPVAAKGLTLGRTARERDHLNTSDCFLLSTWHQPMVHLQKAIVDFLRGLSRSGLLG